ncbi:MAG TPA: hypothetical protein V6D19_11080 [Stenomitos sp.]
MTNPITPLIELRRYYEGMIARSEQQATEAKAQIVHIDALLLDVFVQSQSGLNSVPTATLSSVPIRPALNPHIEALATQPTPEILPVIETVAALPESTKGRKSKKKDALPLAIAASDTQMSASEENKTETSEENKAETSQDDDGLTLLAAYVGLNKLEAIAKVLSEQPGQVMHQDAILQHLYGPMSPAQLKHAGPRLRASLYQGVAKGLWQKAPHQRSSYVLTPSQQSAPTQKPATPEVSKARAESSTLLGKKSQPTTPKKTTQGSVRGRSQILNLPAPYTGLSKIEAVAKVLADNPGQAMHIDHIIQHLYGELAPAEAAAEKVRMKDVMKRGIEKKLWNKAKGIPSTIVIGEVTEASAAQPLAQPKNQQLQKVTKPKAKAPSQKRQPKRKQAELVALLHKANIML